MKKFSFFGGMFVVMAITFALILAGCSGGGSGFDEEFNVTAADFDSTIKSICQAPGNYLINLSGDLLNYPGIWMDTAGVNITVRGTGSNRITWRYAEAYESSLFWVSAGKLTLENITLGRGLGGSEDWALLWLDGGTAEIKNGVTLSHYDGNNYHTSVYLEKKSTLIMSGGTITDCGTGIELGGDGCSVTISGGTIENCDGHGISSGGNGNSITVSGGIIRNITGCGIGLWSSNATVAITGGEITGGVMGVFLAGNDETLTISGGKIHGEEWFGVYVGEGSGHTVTKTGGTVTGGNAPYYADSSATVVVTGF